MSAAHTPGPWLLESEPTEFKGVNVRWGIDSQHRISIASGQSQEHINGICEAECLANARLIAAAPELLEALEAYRTARAMPSHGDYAAIPWESKAGPVNPVWGGGDCAKHGRWYGRCHCCADEWDKLRVQADRDAVHARDNALRAADEKARAAIAKATGGAQ